MLLAVVWEVGDEHAFRPIRLLVFGNHVICRRGYSICGVELDVHFANLYCSVELILSR